MRIHNDSLIRVVLLARIVGALLIVGGMLLASMAIMSAIRSSSGSIPWTRLAVALAGGVLPGCALLVFATMLDHRRLLAFYAIAGAAAVEVILAGGSMLMTMNPRPAAVLLPMLALAAACGAAWHQAQSLRSRPYVPPKPIPSTAVVIPPPPARNQSNPEPQQAPMDASPAMVIEIRRA